ncbi:flagellar biosynthetic protein FlhB [Chitinivorax tropicus]|uniref:Flagellar biosynthetic protein FlhB n=1 Tax=Chitinivorax tropicus TaxID=714531 RepID=A0A840MLA8_9PROT|nr:flagellar biosynthesis protein FlhB [Chitinivorax tropicus]MBB5017667.1 flagellar biosynthetic protein FlhB [Chitinivorax tropicus]
MAEDSDQERTEPASGRRLEEARQKGNIARSKELPTFAVTMTGIATLVLMGPSFIDFMQQVVRDGLTFDRNLLAHPHQMLEVLYKACADALLAFLPFMLAVTIAAIVSPLLLGGWLLTFEALEPKFSKLNPLSGIKRLFSMSALAEGAKAILKSFLIGGVAGWVIWLERGEFLALITESPFSAYTHTAALVAYTLEVVAGSMIILVILDVPFQLWNYQRSLRMTKEEVRQESKESEGSPEIKARIRALQREAARKRMMQEVPKADVIVTNPTHYAVALKYQSSIMRAPTVVAKGSHLLAERIIELAGEHGVTIMRAPPFARALYFHAELQQEIPAKLYTAAAEVLAYVYQLRHYRQYGGHAPDLPEHLPVPDELDPEAEPKTD